MRQRRRSSGEGEGAATGAGVGPGGEIWGFNGIRLRCTGITDEDEARLRMGTE